jgi:hypothetical protein
MVFQICLTARAEPDRGIVGLRELEFLGVGGLPVMDELEPLKKTGPSKQQFTSGAPLRATKLEIARAAALDLISWMGLACRVDKVANFYAYTYWTETSYLTINSRPTAASQGTKALPAILNY